MRVKFVTIEFAITIHSFWYLLLLIIKPAYKPYKYYRMTISSNNTLTTKNSIRFMSVETMWLNELVVFYTLTIF